MCVCVGGGGSLRHALLITSEGGNGSRLDVAIQLVCVYVPQHTTANSSMLSFPSRSMSDKFQIYSRRRRNRNTEILDILTTHKSTKIATAQTERLQQRCYVHEVLTAPFPECPPGVWTPASPALLCPLSGVRQPAAGTGVTQGSEQSIARTCVITGLTWNTPSNRLRSSC